MMNSKLIAKCKFGTLVFFVIYAHLIHGQFRVEDGRLALYLYRANESSFDSTESWCSILGGVIPVANNQNDLDFMTNFVFEKSMTLTYIWLSGNVLIRDSASRIVWQDGTSDFGTVTNDHCYYYPDGYSRNHYNRRRYDCCKTVLKISERSSEIHAYHCGESGIHQLCLIKQTKHQSESFIKAFAEETIMSMLLSANQTQNSLESWKNDSIVRINNTLETLATNLCSKMGTMEQKVEELRNDSHKYVSSLEFQFNSSLNESAKNITDKTERDTTSFFSSTSVAIDRFKNEIQRTQELFLQEVRHKLEGGNKDFVNVRELIDNKVDQMKLEMHQLRDFNEGKHEKTNAILSVILVMTLIVVAGFIYKYIKVFTKMKNRLEKLKKQNDKVELNNFTENKA